MVEDPIDGHSDTDVELAETDAHGQAALLLVESLIHGLVARSVISVTEAVEIVDIATDAKFEIAEELSDLPATPRSARTMLTAISTSLSQDIPRGDHSGPTSLR